MTAKVFHSAQLCLQFSKNRNGTPRAEPHVMHPDNGRITAPVPDDDQGRLAFLSVSREEGAPTLIFIDQGHLVLVDEVTQLAVVFDGSRITVSKGHGDDRKAIFQSPIG